MHSGAIFYRGHPPHTSSPNYVFFKVGDANVSSALSLVGYEKDIEAAMKFVFGSSFICKDMEDAKKVSII